MAKSAAEKAGDSANENLKHVYWVEVIYKQPTVRNAGTPEAFRDVEIAVQTYEFLDENKGTAKQAAEAFMERTIRTGLKLYGGSVLRSILTPSSILQIGLVDKALYEQEMAEMNKESEVENIVTKGESTAEFIAPPVSANVPELTESASVNVNETS